MFVIYWWKIQFVWLEKNVLGEASIACQAATYGLFGSLGVLISVFKMYVLKISESL